MGARSHAFAYHTDGLESTREVTSGSGTMVATYQTDAFGNPLATGGSFRQPFQFTGQQADPLSLNRSTNLGDNPASPVGPAVGATTRGLSRRRSPSLPSPLLDTPAGDGYIGVATQTLAIAYCARPGSILSPNRV
jgi:hypothetical protein